MQEFDWKIPANHKNRTVDWYWAIGLITIVGATTAFIVGNALFGIFILLGGGLLFYTNLHHGDDTDVHINEKEIVVNGLRYRTKKMHSFAITKSGAEDDILIVRTDRFFMPMLILHISDDISLSDLEETLSVRIKKEDLREPPANAVAEKLGF
ncbi:MAG: hypothetical protein RL641_906 [Candidatus Parcubacteria bacterium]|jgi:hypothetical protein